MVDKKSLRSSKKDTNDPPKEDEKPKPTRTRSSRGRKPKNADEPTSGTDETPQAPPSQQSEDVVMETESVSAPEKTNEDVEMKTDDVAEKKDDDVVPKEDTTASPLTGMPRLFLGEGADGVVIKQNLQLLDKAVATLDPRFTYRVLK